MRREHRDWIVPAFVLAVALANPACHEGQTRGSGTPCTSNGDCVFGFSCVDRQCRASTPNPPTDAMDAPADETALDIPTEPPTDVPDAPPNPDGRPYPPRSCDLTKPFERLSLVTDLESVPGTPDEAPRLSYDELTLYFSSGRSGNVLIYTATRSRRVDPFSMARLLPNLQGVTVDQSPTITADGLTLYFESDRHWFYSLQRSTRPDVTSDWSPATRVDSVSIPSAAFGDGGPYVSPDGKVLYFHSNRLGNLDIYRTERSGADFGPSYRVLGIVTAQDEARPVFSEDELTLFFASGRPDGGAKGGWDIWMATRRSKTAPFDPPTNVSELNTDGYDHPGWLSADQCDLYYGSTAASGDLRISVAHRPLKPDTDAGH